MPIKRNKMPIRRNKVPIRRNKVATWKGKNEQNPIVKFHKKTMQNKRENGGMCE